MQLGKLWGLDLKLLNSVDKIRYLHCKGCTCTALYLDDTLFFLEVMEFLLDLSRFIADGPKFGPFLG